MSRTVIRANQAWWNINWRELVEYHDLLWFLIKRDFTTVYKQSILGPLWFVIQPLATTLVFTVIFGNIAGMGTDGVPPFLFYMSAMVLWNYFQSCLNDVANTFVGNAHLFGKVYFPRLIVPFALTAKNVGQLVLNFLMFLGFYIYFATRPTSLGGYRPRPGTSMRLGRPRCGTLADLDDRQIPRFAVCPVIPVPIVDVCHADHLLHQQGTRKMDVGNLRQPDVLRRCL